MGFGCQPPAARRRTVASSRAVASLRACVAVGVGASLVAAGMPVAPAGAAVVSWTATTVGASWGASSWSVAGGPGTGDTANFTDTGSFTLAGEPTSVLNADRTIAGLIFTNASSKFHTLDLNGKTLTVNGSVNFNTDGSGTTTTTVRNGTLVLAGAFSNLNVGRASAGSSNGSADLSGLTALNANLAEWHVGSSASGATNATLTLSPSNTVTTGKWFVGDSSATSDARATVHLGLANTVNTAEAYVGRDRGNATVDVVGGGVLTLGSAAQRTLLQVGVGNLLNNADYTGRLDLTGGRLNATLASLTVGQKEGGGFGDAVGLLVAGTGGAIDIGASGNTANLFVGRKLTGGNDSGAIGTADFSGAASLTANLDQLAVGTALTGTATGTLRLAVSNAVNANSIVVGSDGGGTNLLALGKTNTVLADSLAIGVNQANGTASIPATGGSSLALGSAARRTSVTISASNALTNSAYAGKLDLSGATFTGFLADLTVGQKDNGGFGSATGTFVAGNAGTVDIGAPGNTANVYVGRKVTGSGDDKAFGSADFSGLASLTANLNALAVGTANTGVASGTLRLAATNTIDAKSILIGSDGGGTNLLNLGRTNAIVADQFTIGQNAASGVATVAAGSGASLTLGTPARRTNLAIATSGVLTDSAYFSRLDLAGGSLGGYLGDLTVGQKSGGGNGTATGTLIGAAGGALDIGATGNTANVYVGRKIAGTDNRDGASGLVDFSGLATVTANVNTISVGAAAAGSATGTLKLAAANTVNANNIVVGSGGGGNNLLALGKTNTVSADQFVIGKDAANATVTVTPGASSSLNLGTPTRRTSLSVSTSGVLTDSAYAGKLDLSGAAFNGYLADLTVGQKEGGGNGTTTGTLIGATGGALDVGATGNTANVYVGRKLAGTDNRDGASGTVDLGGLTSLAANLNTLSVGTAVAGAAQGSVTLPTTVTLNAKDVTVGAGGGSNLNQLCLGRTNTVLADQFTVGKDAAGGSVTIIPGGTLALGSPARRTTLSIATGGANDNNGWIASVDLTGATLTAYLDSVTIGNKSSTVSGKTGTLTISDRPGNFMSANAISLGAGNAGATGTLNFGGGQLFAGTVSKGAATANFNWTGGQLSVGTFGTAAFPFNLNNAGTGTLAPGSLASAVGTTTVYGNYAQASSGTTAIEIAGNAPGTGNDLVAVTGSATLAGTLTVTLLNGFAPSVGQSFVIGTQGSRNGTYAFVAPPTLPANVAFQVDYSSPTQTVLRAVAPVAQTWSANTSGTFATAGNWSTGTTPTTSSDLTIANPTATPEVVTVSASTTVHRVSLQGTNAAVTLNVPQGVQLGVANQVTVGTNAALTGGGQVLGNVVVGGSGSLAPGTAGTADTLKVAGNLTAQPGATVKLDVGGRTPGTQHDLLNIAGVATVGGTLRVDLVGGYVPNWGDAFAVATWAGASGRFAAEQTTAPAGYGFAAGYRSDGLTLTYARLGDANLDGTVGIDDLAALAQNYGQSSRDWVQGDFNYDGVVTIDDLAALAQNYNTSAGAGGGATGAGSAVALAAFAKDYADVFGGEAPAGAVPEPSTARPRRLS
jgi:hypothetical protein